VTETAIADMPFETAMKELEEIVKKLEAGALSLEDSIVAYERGEHLKARCDALLAAAEARIEKISLGPDGKPKGVEPLDATNS
jgi:exodeoxyribonuclease VII small subunit